jgi:hypothetical protein
VTAHPNASLAYAFLGGGGEIASRMRAFDWSKTPLGPVDSWPQSLRSTVSMLSPQSSAAGANHAAIRLIHPKRALRGRTLGT